MDHKKPKGKRKIIRILLFVFCIGVLAFCAVSLADIWMEDSRGDAMNEQLKKYVSVGHADAAHAKPQDCQVDFAGLKSMNQEITAWLVSPDTVIDYPVVQGADNSYYLTHAFGRQTHKYGCLFVDAANSPSFSDQNTVIYGHRMNSGAMFGSLLEYRKQQYYDEHPFMLLYTPENDYKLEIFTAYVAKDASYTQKVFAPGEFQEFLSKAKGKSLVGTDADVEAGDKIITLSTCTVGGDDERFVVQAKLTVLG